MLQQIIVFVLFLCPLIFFHELGHFLFARLFGVRVETFSIGFGKKIFQFKKGDTTYAFSLIPLGGYVKMFGDDPLGKDLIPEAERVYAYNHKSIWARFWIVFGGPLANFILAFFIYWGLTTTGETVPELRFANFQNQNLQEVGVRPSDRLVAINGKAVESVEDLVLLDGDINSLTVNRLGMDKNFNVLLSQENFINVFFKESTPLTKPIIYKNTQRFFVSASKEIDEQRSLEEIILNSPVYLLTEKGEVVSEIGSDDNFYQKISSEGYSLPELIIGNVFMGTPADKAGLRQGDFIFSINGTKINHFQELRDIIQVNGVKENLIVYRRDGKEYTANLVPEEKTIGDKKMYSIGVQSAFEFYSPKMVDTVPKGIVEGLAPSIARTWNGFVGTLMGFKKLISGQMSMDAIGGPVAIAKVASDSLDVSISYFFKIMALMSINLGLINLFPVPVLDGGHIMFLFFELIKGKPLDRKMLEVAHRFGLTLLLALIVLALFNDFSRLI